MKYAKRTWDVARAIRGLYDECDWGYRSREGHPVSIASGEMLKLWWRGDVKQRWQRLTKTLIESHLEGTDVIYYRPSRKSDTLLTCVDLDAHEGQVDVDRAMKCVMELFPNSYWQPSTGGRGRHVFVKIDVKYKRRHSVNCVLRELQSALRRVLLSRGVETTLDVIGTYTLKEEREDGIEARMGQLCPLPKPLTEEALKSFIDAPIWEYQRVLEVAAGDSQTRAVDGRLYRPDVSGPSVVEDCFSGDSFIRMGEAKRDYSTLFQADPDLDQLLSHYQHLYPNTGPCNPGRVKRVKYVLKTSDFNPDKACGSGWSNMTHSLLQSITQYVKPEYFEDLKYNRNLTNEDIALALYAITLNSFAKQDSAIKQYCVPLAAFSGVVEHLRNEGLTDRAMNRRNKIKGCKTILERSGLIQCLDDSYRFSICPISGERDKDYGVGKKYVPSVNHPMFERWCRWAENVEVKLIGGKSDRTDETEETRDTPSQKRTSLTCQTPVGVNTVELTRATGRSQRALYVSNSCWSEHR